MTADQPRRTLVIESSPTKLLVLVGLGLLMTAGAIAVALLPGTSSIGKIVGGYFGSVFFALCTATAFWRLVASRGPVITISPEGIRDTRVAAAVIPWSAITGVSTWTYRGQKVMVLAVRPGIEERLGLTRIARWTRGANRALGADGLCVTASGLKIDYDTLFETTLDYLRRARESA
jgi:hypothetical protein